MKRRKLTYIPLTALLAAILLSACTQPPAPVAGTSSAISEAEASSVSPVPEAGNTPDTVNILEQMDALYAQLDTAPIPQQEGEIWGSTVDLAKGTAEHLPPQLIKNEPRAYALSQQIRALLYPSDNVTADFASIESAYRPALLQMAIYHTAPLDINWSWDPETKAFSVSSYQDHVIPALIKHEVQEGRSPSDIYSGESVRATMQQLFGDDVEYFDMDTAPYYYYAREDVYFRVGDFGGPYWRYPQITAYQETDTGVTVETVLVWALDKDTPLEVDGTPLTAQNFEALTAKNTKLRLTFQKAEDGRLVLSAWQTLRAGTV